MFYLFIKTSFYLYLCRISVFPSFYNYQVWYGCRYYRCRRHMLAFPHPFYATVITPRIVVNQNAFHFSSYTFQTLDSFRWKENEEHEKKKVPKTELKKNKAHILSPLPSLSFKKNSIRLIICITNERKMRTQRK